MISLNRLKAIRALVFGIGLGVSTVGSAQQLMQRAWGMNSGHGIDVSKAWTTSKKSRGGDCSKSTVIVAVIDTGIDMKHPALKDSLWVNTIEANGKPGVDDDKNGLVDDMNGWDFAKKTAVLSDPHGHGTHIAGIISANGKGADGFRGVCPGVKIMALRYYDEKASGDVNLLNTVKAINYAVDNGAHIINYSGGGAMFSRPEYNALKRAEEKGIVVVAAAGNEHNNADKDLYFPAAYNLKDIISVTAIDTAGLILPSSNWGVQKVHVAAPGNSILSTLPNNSYGFMTGTSQATAFVSGITALLLTENPKLTVAKLKSLIEDSSLRSPALSGKTKTSGYVNAYSAIRLSQGKRSLSSTKGFGVETISATLSEKSEGRIVQPFQTR